SGFDIDPGWNDVPPAPAWSPDCVNEKYSLRGLPGGCSPQLTLIHGSGRAITARSSTPVGTCRFTAAYSGDDSSIEKAFSTIAVPPSRRQSGTISRNRGA